MSDILINIISIIVTAVVIPIITALGANLVRLVTSKINDEKAAKIIQNASNVVLNAVKSVFQTYVDTLKKEGKFGAEAQLVALDQAKNIALSHLCDESKKFLAYNFGDVDAWLVTQIEATINTLKHK